MTEQKYRPENPQYLIPEEYSTFPRELSFGKTEEEAIKAAMERFISEPTSSTVVRELDETEIANVRGEYTDLMENVRPEEQQKLADLLSEKARIEEKIKAQKEVLQSITQHVNDCIQTIKGGTTNEELDAARSFRMAVDGHYLHYTYSGGRFVLANVNRIPSADMGNIFTRQTANQEVFLHTFGADFSPAGNFEEHAVCEDTAEELIGRKLAAAPEFYDDFNNLVKVADRDTEIDEALFHELLEKGIEWVFTYRIHEDVASEA